MEELGNSSGDAGAPGARVLCILMQQEWAKSGGPFLVKLGSEIARQPTLVTHDMRIHRSIAGAKAANASRKRSAPRPMGLVFTTTVKRDREHQAFIGGQSTQLSYSRLLLGITSSHKCKRPGTGRAWAALAEGGPCPSLPGCSLVLLEDIVQGPQVRQLCKLLDDTGQHCTGKRQASVVARSIQVSSAAGHLLMLCAGCESPLV